MYVYKRAQGENLYTVGFYDPSGRWIPESDWSIREEAIERVHYLNGGGISPNTRFILDKLIYSIEGITKAIQAINERQELDNERAEILQRPRDRLREKWVIGEE